MTICWHTASTPKDCCAGVRRFIAYGIAAVTSDQVYWYTHAYRLSEAGFKSSSCRLDGYSTRDQVERDVRKAVARLAGGADCVAFRASEPARSFGYRQSSPRQDQASAELAA